MKINAGNDQTNIVNFIAESTKRNVAFLRIEA